MGFLIVVSSVFAGLAGMTALLKGDVAYGLVILSCAVLVCLAGLEAFK